VKNILKTVDRISELCGKVFGWFILLLIATMIYEVIMRYVFRNPTLWSYDATYLLSSLVLVMGFAWNHRDEGNVRVDVIYTFLSKRAQALVNAVMTILFFIPLFIIGFSGMIPDVIHAWSIKEKAMVSSIQPPIYPFKTWILFALVLLFIQGIAELVRYIIVVLRGENI
jgi:TRAP-type mannitol/chloroaromatic compound transport system permease small subunit